jgi:hypothetical protein
VHIADDSDYPLSRYGMGAFRTALEAVYKVSQGHQIDTAEGGFFADVRNQRD